MLEAVARPLKPLGLAASALGVCSAIALYCLAYSALNGRSESIAGAFGWALVNVLPWLLAFEVSKRHPRKTSVVAMLVAAFAASLLLGLLLTGNGFDLAFEALRRVPGLAVTAALVGWVQLRWEPKARSRGDPVELPLIPEQIDWIRAAGNYIEIRSGGRVVIHRASLGAAEGALLAHGFVRIHRSTLVRRDSIARIRPGDVVLRDGTSLKTGRRYRALLSA